MNEWIFMQYIKSTSQMQFHKEFKVIGVNCIKLSIYDIVS